ncbi:MAG TPA: hypothetical protein PLV61_16885 [Parvularculaceae bacterium]|nr:hypothetical protein [Amphiplicatus sp.]HPE32873.1 hypothetical protein [Parvularculaceae bacterium]
MFDDIVRELIDGCKEATANLACKPGIDCSPLRPPREFSSIIGVAGDRRGGNASLVNTSVAAPFSFRFESSGETIIVGKVEPILPVTAIRLGAMEPFGKRAKRKCINRGEAFLGYSARVEAKTNIIQKRVG